MTEIVKICKKHGNLTDNKVIKSGFNKGKQRYKCKLCMKEIHANNYKNNKEKILSNHENYRKLNPEKIKNSKRKNWIKHREKYLEQDNARRKKFKELHPELYKEWNTKRVRELYDSYVLKILLKDKKLKKEEMPDSIIKLKRALIQMRRKIKEITAKRIIEKNEKN